MGLFAFIKEAGEKLFGGGEAKAGTADANTAAAKAIKDYIGAMKLSADNLEVAFDGSTGTVTVSGQANDQETREKIVLCCGNVAHVDKVVDKKGTRKLAQEYLDYLWSKEGQENAAQNYLRPRDAETLKKHASQFPAVKTFTVDEVFGGWAKAYPAHFKDGGSFDQIYQSK